LKEKAAYMVDGNPPDVIAYQALEDWMDTAIT
jgi:hypothetical protein